MFYVLKVTESMYESERGKEGMRERRREGERERETGKKIRKTPAMKTAELKGTDPSK